MTDVNNDLVVPVPEHVSDEVKTFYSKRMNSLYTAAQQLVALNKRSRQIPESFFYCRLLPIIRDWIRGIDNEDIAVWLNIADGKFKGIEVIDDNTNEILFETPPVFFKIPPVVFDRNKKMKQTLADIVAKQDIAIVNGDTRLVMEYEQNLPKLFDFEHNDVDYINYLKMYLAIYRRYDLPLEELFGEHMEIADILDGSNKTVSVAETKLEPPELTEDDYVF